MPDQAKYERITELADQLSAIAKELSAMSPEDSEEASEENLDKETIAMPNMMPSMKRDMTVAKFRSKYGG